MRGDEAATRKEATSGSASMACCVSSGKGSASGALWKTNSPSSRALTDSRRSSHRPARYSADHLREPIAGHSLTASHDLHTDGSHFCARSRSSRKFPSFTSHSSLLDHRSDITAHATVAHATPITNQIQLLCIPSPNSNSSRRFSDDLFFGVGKIDQFGKK